MGSRGTSVADRLRQLRFKALALWRGSTQDDDMAEEMRAHLDRLIAANGGAGVDADTARLEALRQFGNLPSLEEHARDERRFRWPEHVIRDVRYAIRQLRCQPSVAATVVLSLAMGLGASVAMFSAVDAILLNDLPFPDADRLGLVQKGAVGTAPDRGVSPANALEIVETAKPFAAIAPFTMTEIVIREHDRAERVAAMRVGAHFFRTLGVAPALGRDFLPSDDTAGAPRVAVISHAVWQRMFTSDPGVVGRLLGTGRDQLTIVGVMPETFRFPELFGTSFTPAIWMPLAFSPNEAAARGAGYMFLLVKRHPQSEWNVVQDGLTAIARAYAISEPRVYRDQELRVTPIHEQVVRTTRPVLLLLWAVVSCFLLIACANAANVVLARTAARSRELAVRASLGASRRRLLAQLVTESLVLAAIAAALGLCLASWLVSLGRYALADFLPRASELAINWRVLQFTLAATCLTSLARHDRGRTDDASDCAGDGVC